MTKEIAESIYEVEKNRRLQESVEHARKAKEVMTETHKAAVEALERIIGEGELGEDDTHHDNDTAKIFFFDDHYRTILKALRTLNQPSSVEVEEILLKINRALHAGKYSLTLQGKQKAINEAIELEKEVTAALRITRAAATDGVKS